MNKIKEVHIGRKASDETKSKMSEGMKGIKKKIIKCPYCDKEGGSSQMKRWHFDNCKFKQENK